MLTVQLLIYLLIVLWIYFLWSRRRFYMLMLKISGPMGYPLIGNALTLRKRETFLQTFEKYERENNYLAYTWLGPAPFILVADPQCVQDLFTSAYCVNRTAVANILIEVMGLGLFNSSEPIWSRDRKMLNPAFNNKVLTSFFPIFNQETKKLLTTMDGLCGCDDVNVFEILKTFVFTLTTRTMMDRDFTIVNTKDDELMIKLYDYMMVYVMDVSLSPWLKSKIVQKITGIFPKKDEAIKQLEDYMRALIDKKIAERQALQPSRANENVFINLALKYMENGSYTYRTVEEHAHVIVLAGFETTNNSIAYTLMILAMFPEYQEKLFEEVITLFPDLGDFDVSVADTQQMVYADMIMNEVMRVMSPIPVIFRELSNDIKLTNGITLPKGLQVCIDMFNLHRRKDIWGPDAHMFNPDNFLPANLEGKHPYSFVPFAKGVRNCIGWRYAIFSIKVVLAKLVRNYKFSTDFKFEDLQFVEDVSLRLKVIPKIKFYRRSS